MLELAYNDLVFIKEIESSSSLRRLYLNGNSISFEKIRVLRRLTPEIPSCYEGDLPKSWDITETFMASPLHIVVRTANSSAKGI
jgi:hypothetical protein